jgi:hypothetical protein
MLASVVRETPTIRRRSEESAKLLILGAFPERDRCCAGRPYDHLPLGDALRNKCNNGVEFAGRTPRSRNRPA